MKPRPESPPRTFALHERIFESSILLREIAERLSEPKCSVSVGRAADSAGSLLLAFLARRLDRPMLCICHSPDEADRTRREWSSFRGEAALEFPPWDALFDEESEPDPDVYALRVEALDALSSRRSVAVVAPLQAILQPVARSGSSAHARVILRVGDEHPPQDLARALVEAGYRRFPQVARPGDFSIRGGIFDVYPREGSHPYRIEFFADEIESIRTVSVSDLRSRHEVGLVAMHVLSKNEFFVRGYTGREVTILDRLPEDAVVVLASTRELTERCESLIGQWDARRARSIATQLWGKVACHSVLQLEDLPPEPGRRPLNLPVRTVASFGGGLDRVLSTLKDEADRGTEVRVLFRNEAESDRFTEIIEESEIGETCQAEIGELTHGFRWQEAGGGVFLSGSEILGRTRTLARRARRVAPSRAVESFFELEVGDYVVHVGHGVGRFRGIRELMRGRRRGDHLVLEFRDGVDILVPAERIDLVQKYVGTAGGPRILDRVGSKSWKRKKERAVGAIHDLAAEMLEVQALRAEGEGFAFPADNEWQQEFEAAFPFEETGDQLQAAAEIRGDLERSRPMDRLICGDVGYGKTELAMRAAFKAVQASKQVAVLVPTTVLAQQHVITFRDRMAEFPVRIDALSRFRRRAEQTEIIRRAREGEIDILIGTHRLLSNDVSFADLGLIIIDEEQRFGVRHKEKLKQLRRLVDILTLTATPIPRTLHLALLGVRDISNIAEAPAGRSAIHTEVCAFEPERFRRIILRELNRDGQVYFVHNRVQTIEARTQELKRLIPEADIVYVHGQMPEGELEERMKRFLEKRYNVLVTTTIIENGLDIPSANTMVVERADRFGLSELHQLRGRVGRGRHQAHAYFLIPDDRPVAPEGRHRLKAIEEFSELGAGFQIAMRDLEIRGAGNILGGEQSGHIGAIGYDLYCRLLARMVADLKGKPHREPPDVELPLPGHCQIPEAYVPDTTSRLKVYRAIATSLSEDQVTEIGESLVDRYGELPPETVTLLHAQRLRIFLGRRGTRRVGLEDGWLILTGDPTSITSTFGDLGWEVVSLDDGSIGVRPRGRSRNPKTINDFHELLLAAPSPGS